MTRHDDLPELCRWPYEAVVHGADIHADCLALTGDGSPCSYRAYLDNDAPVCNLHADVDDPELVVGAHQWARISDGGRDVTVAVCVACKEVWHGGSPAIVVDCPDCGQPAGARCHIDRGGAGTSAPIPPHPDRRAAARRAVDGYDECSEFDGGDAAPVLATDGGTESVSALFSLVVEIADEVGFSFEEPNGHLNDDGVWLYQLDTDDDYGWIMAGDGDEPFETQYPGWGDIEVQPFRLVPFVNEAVAGVLTPTSGSVGGLLGLELYPDELEDHLIAMYCDELEHLGGDASEWREMIDGDPLEGRDSLRTDGGETGGRSTSNRYRVSILDEWPLKLYEDATEAWGEDAQITLAQEELAELSVELARNFRGRNGPEDVVDEIADVLIAANQLALIYGIEKTEERVEYKLQRLRDRVDRAVATESEREDET